VPTEGRDDLRKFAEAIPGLLRGQVVPSLPHRIRRRLCIPRRPRHGHGRRYLRAEAEDTRESASGASDASALTY